MSKKSRVERHNPFQNPTIQRIWETAVESEEPIKITVRDEKEAARLAWQLHMYRAAIRERFKDVPEALESFQVDEMEYFKVSRRGREIYLEATIPEDISVATVSGLPIDITTPKEKGTGDAE